MRIEIILPWPPSANQMYRHVGSKVLISERGRKYRMEVAEVLARLGNPRLEGRLFLSLQAFPPDKRKHDADNLLKGIFDGLMKAGLFEDDSQIKKLEVEMLEVATGGRVIAVVGEVTP